MNWHNAFTTGQFSGVPKYEIMMQLWHAIESRRQLVWTTPPSGNIFIPPTPFPKPDSMPEFQWYQRVHQFIFGTEPRDLTRNNSYNARLCNPFGIGKSNYIEDMGHYHVGNINETYLPQDGYISTQFEYNVAEYTLAQLGQTEFITPDQLKTQNRETLYQFYMQCYKMLNLFTGLTFNHWSWYDSEISEQCFIICFGERLREKTIHLIDHWRDTTPTSIYIDENGFMPINIPTGYSGTFLIAPYLEDHEGNNEV